MWIHVLTHAACAVYTVFQFRKILNLHQQLNNKHEEVGLLRKERLEERNGRTKAERQLREIQLKLASTTEKTGNVTNITNNTESIVDLSNVAFPLKPIGTFHSCFNKRNGTPRQPLLVPAARGSLTLRSDIKSDIFNGLEQYSHCWVLYIFHENTNLQQLWATTDSGQKTKIRVPRLNGDRLGVYATRSPHRPCPIGLSVAKIVQIDGRKLILGGIDIVDNSPVLDVKPYVPFCDIVADAKAPLWVAPIAEDGDEPLEIERVEISSDTDGKIHTAWRERRNKHPDTSLYAEYEEYKTLVMQVLSRDIRSVAQRIKVPKRLEQQQKLKHAIAALPALYDTNGGSDGHVTTASSSHMKGIVDDPSAEASEDTQHGKWHVELDGIDLTYDVIHKVVVLKSAQLLN